MNFAAAGRALAPSRLLRALLRRRDDLSSSSGGRWREGPGHGIPAVQFEALEQRVLLSADLVFNLADGANDVTVTGANADGIAVVQVIDNLTQSVLAQHEQAGLEGVTLIGSSGTDCVTVDLSFDLDVPVCVIDSTAGDADRLSVISDGAQWVIDGADAGQVLAGAGVAFAGIEYLQGGDDNVDRFAFESAGTISGGVEGGEGGYDTLVLASGSFAQIVFAATGPQSGMVARDADTLVYSGFEPVVMNAVANVVTVLGTPGADEITIRERGTAIDDRFQVVLDTAEDIVVNLTNLDKLVVQGGGGDDTFLLEYILQLASVDVEIEGGLGNDSLLSDENALDVPQSLKYTGDVDAFDEIRVSASSAVTATDLQLTAGSATVDLVGIERLLVRSTSSLDVSGFSGLAMHLSSTPSWDEIGPSGFNEILDGQLSPWDPKSGAINTLVVDPSDRFTMYLGTVNGGVWRNTGGTEVRYALGESDLTADDKVTLDAFVEFLFAHPGVKVEIAGHTDATGEPDANEALGLLRANKVKTYLLSQQIEESRLTVKSYGETQPIAKNDPTTLQSAENRRVELLVDNWEPLTDEMPAMSIASLALSPLDSDVLYAGIGRTSSFGSTGGFQTGLLFSADGGDHWSVLASERLRGLTVTKVLPTTWLTGTGAQVVFVSTYDEDADAGKPGDTGLDDKGGLFRLEVNAADGTLEKIEKVSGAGDIAGAGLPLGHYTDLAFDPGNLLEGRDSRVYAANPTQGIYALLEGQTAWQAVNNGLQMGTDSDLDGNDDLLQEASRIRMSLHEDSGTLWVGVLGPVDGNGIFALGNDRFGLIGMFKSTDSGANWTDMTVPTTVDNAVTYGLHPGRQGDTHFSILVDPTNPDIVYIGGDRQGDTTNNSAGLSVSGGRLFRYDDTAGQWEQIVGTNADDTVPHADSRGLVFVGNYQLYELDDGGLNRLQNPRGEDAALQGDRRWASQNQGLRITEVLRLAYDPLNDDILIGTQDNGSAHQGAGDTDGLDNDDDGTIDEADEAVFWGGTGGDGNTQAVIAIDTDANGTPDRTLRYSLHNDFNFLQIYQFTGTGVMEDLDPASSTFYRNAQFRSGPGAAFLSGLNGQDQGMSFDLIPMAVNANDPTRMVIGYYGIYESINTNINPAAGQPRVLPLDEVRQIDPAPAAVVPDGSEVAALVYGGKVGATRFDDLVLAARANKVLVRVNVGDAFSEHVVAGAGTLRDIVVDPSNWKVVYAIDNTRVFRIADITDPTKTWVDITANLAAIGQGGLRTLEYVESAASDVLLVGGIGGVSRLFLDTNPAGGEKWIRFGTGLPNAPVFDLHYLDLNAPGVVSGADRLIAGTMGRGVWSVSGPDILSLGNYSTLEIFGADTADDLLFVRDAANPTRFKLFDLAQSSTTPILGGRGATFDQIQINLRGGNDTLTVDHGEGAVSVPRGIAVDGGVGSNTVVFKGGAYTSYSNGTTPGGLPFYDIVDLGNKLQRVIVENATIDDSALPTPLNTAFKTVSGAVEALVKLLTFADGLAKNLPVLGTSLGRALNGVDVSEPPPNGTRGVSAPSLAQSIEVESGQAVDLLRRFIETGKGAFDISDLAGMTTLAQIEQAFEGLSESGGSVDVSGDLTTGFTVALHGIAKTLTGRADVALDLFNGLIDLEGQVDVSALVTLDLTFGVDNTHGFYILSDADPDILVDHIAVSLSDDVKAYGKFGFLGVGLTELSLTTAPGTRLEIDLEDADGYVTLAELGAALDDYVDVTLVKAPGAGVKDVEAVGKFAVNAFVPGQAAPFSLFDARARITWDDIDAVALNAAPNVSVTAEAGAAGAEDLLRFLDVKASDLAARLTTLKANLESIFGAEVPYLSDSLTQLVGLVNVFQTKVLDPLTSGVGFQQWTIQDVIASLADRLGVLPSQLGLGYDQSSNELSYHLVLSEQLLNATRSLGAGVDLAEGLADLEISADATVSATVALDTFIGVDLDQVLGDPRDWFFLRDASASLTASLEAHDIEATARFGFLSIGIDQGSLTDLAGTGPATVSVTVQLVDPDTGNPGRVNLGEILDNLDSPGDLLKVTGGGSLMLVLPVEATLVGLADIPDGTPLASLLGRAITITLADLSDPSTFDVKLGSDITLSVGNFANIDAAGVVGALGQLTYWFDQFRNSSTFQSLNLPLVGPVLDNALQLADAFRDTLLIDDKDNGQDDAKTLLFDLNAALADAGLGRKLYATNEGGFLVLQALDASIASFTVDDAGPLGFADGQAGSKGPGDEFARALAGIAFANVQGKLGADLQFNVGIGTRTYNVKLRKSDTDNNTRVGDDRWKLVNADNAPNFATAQQMTPFILDALGIDALQYDAGAQTLTFSLDLSQVFAQLDLPFAIDVKELPAFLQLQTSGQLALRVTGDLNLEVGLFLGNAEPSDKLDSGTALADLSEPVVLDSNQRYTADVIVGKLTADATFKVFVDGSATGTDVTVTQAAATDNKTVADLVADLNQALQTAGLSAKVLAQAVPAAAGQPAPNQVQFVGQGGATALKITAAAGSVAATGLGLGSSAEDTTAGDGIKVVAAKALPPLKGRLSADASFDLLLAGEPAKHIVLAAEQTANNEYPFSIVNDLQAVIDPAQNPRVVVGFSNGALTFSTTDGSSIQVANANAVARNELGIVNRAGNSEDLLITLRNGSTHRVSFDSGDTTIQHIVDAIESGTDHLVSVVTNDAGSGLWLLDSTTGASSFKVQTLNNSTAGLLLGIVRADAAPGETPDGKIEGADIAALTALDRFFIKATPEGQDALAGLSVEIGTPQPLTASAKFGFVSLGLQGEGGLDVPPATTMNNVLQADLTLRLIEPAGSTDGRVSLAEMLDALDSLGDAGSMFELSLTGAGQLDLSLTADTMATLANLGIDVGTEPRIEISVDMTDNVFETAPVFDVQTVGFDELGGFGNLDFNFQSIVAGLAALVDFLDDFEALGFLNDPIPVIDVSVKDLVSIAQRFADAVTAAQNDPAGSLQLLETKLEAAFGLPAGSDALDLVLVDGPGGSKVLKIDTALTASFSKSLPISLDLGLDPLELGGDADLLAEGSVRLDLDFGFDITNPLDLYVFDSTGLSATLDLSATALDFKAAVGPLGVFIQNGSATIAGSLGGNKVLTAGFADKLGADDMALVSDVVDAFLDDPDNVLGIAVGGTLDVKLPVYFPTESVFAGEVKVTGSLSYNSATDALTASLTPDIPDGIFDFNPADMSLLDQLLLGVDGVDMFLEGLQDLLDGTLGGFELPMLGDKLSGAADAIGGFRSGFVESFRTAIADLANPALAFAEAGISAPAPGVMLLSAPSAPQGVDPVSKLLWQLLGPTGLQFVDSKDDIVFDTNIHLPGIAPQDVFFDWDIHMGGPLANAGAGIGFDLGIPGLGLETEGNIQLAVDWALDLGFGLNFDDGFYLDIGKDSELQLTATVTTPGLGITGRLGFLQIQGEENVEAVDDRGSTGLTAQFGIDILNRKDGNDERLGFSELGSIGIDAKIAGRALIDLQLQLMLNSDLVPNPGNFPSIVADFAFDWGLGTVDDPLTQADEFAGVSLSGLKGGFLSNGLQYIGFDNVGLDLGKYFSDVIGPIVDKVQEVTAPIKPFLDFLTEPIPVISDLAGPTSLLDIASMSGLVNPGIIKAIEVVDQVVDIVADLKSAGGTTILYVDELLPGGALTIYQAPAQGFAALAGGGGIPGFDPSKPINLDNLKSFVENSLPKDLGFLSDVLGSATDAFSKAVSKMRPGGGADEGFSLPIIEDPSQIFGMLLGQPADLVKFTMAPMTLEAEFSAFFSIFGPLGVSINAEFDAQFGPFTFGYDTLGITQFAAGDFRNPLLLFNGLYVGDLDAQGNDIAELQFDAGLWAAAELNLGIARGGVGGGLFAEIDFNLYDPDHDGKVRIDELIHTIDNEIRYGDPALAPLSIFDISGKLTAELFAFLKIDFGFFEVDEKFQITDPIELLSFANVFERYPTLATELGGGVLQLNMGKNASSRVEGDLSDGSEVFYVKAGSPGHVKVWAPQFGITEDEAQEYLASKIVAFGGEGDDQILFQGGPIAVGVELYGDAGDDTFDAAVITGAAFMVGGAGDDELIGGSGGDTLFGGTGVDTLRGNAGNDWLIGDGDHKEYLTDAVITVAVKGSDGNDFLYGGDNDDLLFGAGGTDWLEGGANDDVLVGDGGQVTVSLADRRVASTRSAALDPGRLELAVFDTSPNGKGALDHLFGQAGNDHLYGGFGADELSGGDNDDVIYGELGGDTADGGSGNDVIFGDFGVFKLVTVGNVSTLQPFATTGGEKDDLSGGAGNDKLLGGAGNDRMQGNDGDDQLWGGVGRDLMWGDNDDLGNPGTGHDKLFGEADSDELRGGAGDDYLEGGGGNDLALGGDGADTLVGGYGSDTMDGEADGDTYRISVRGGATTELTTAYDTGATGVDTLVVVGTPGDDTVLLRAMADSYFPTLKKLQDLSDKFFSSTIADRLAAMVQAFTDAYGPWDFPPGLIDALTAAYQAGLDVKLKAAVQANRDGLTPNDEPKLADLDVIVDEVLASNAASKLDALKLRLGKAYTDAGVDIPSTLFSALTAAYKRDDGNALTDIHKAIADYYVAESLYPANLGLQLVVDEVFADADFADDQFADAAAAAAARAAEIELRIGQAFGSAFPAQLAGVIDALRDAWDNDIDLDNDDAQTQRTKLKDAIDTAYVADPVDPATFNNTAFVAVINDGGAHVERFNYRRMEGLVVSTMGGADYVVLDDLLAAATINLGDGNDRVQIGQVFRSERVRDFEGEPAITGITAEDVFTTVEITRGWLSNGVSVATTINGGDGDDNFTVFRNVAVLNLNGGDGDDVFTVRAFALKGSTDNERARTDMKGDGGADTILYVVNAPVGIDGGDGFDTVRIVGTEFGDDFVVTDTGIFGAGLNVSYVNVERLVADGAEGDDRFFIMSTGLDVVTEIDGGLGSDTFFVGGNPSRAPVAVVSNDLRGHSGIILHSVDAASDEAWRDVPIEGLSANVGDNEEPMILLAETGGRSLVVEGALSPALGATDSYRLRLSRAPTGKVALAVVPAGLSPEDQAKNYADLEVSIDGGTTWGATATVIFDINDPNPVKRDAWRTGIEVMFRAKQDVGYEGRRFTFINHKVTEQTTDASFLDAQVRSLKVQMEDDDRDGVLVLPSGLDNTVLEGGFNDSFQVVLTRAPTADVFIALSLAGAPGQLSLSTSTLKFTTADWMTPKTVTVTAIDDGVVEGFHTEFVRFAVTSADQDQTLGPFVDGQVVKVNGNDVTVAGGWLQIDADIEASGVQELTDAKPSTYVLLPHRPIAGTVMVRVGGEVLSAGTPDDPDDPPRFSVTGNTVTFLTASGAPEFRVGKVEVNYQYKVVGYDGLDVRDQYVDIYDNDAPAVIVRPGADSQGLTDGMLDVVEGDPAGMYDTYTVRLSQQPTQKVLIDIDPAKTRTTWGANAYFAKQVLVSLDGVNFSDSITLEFDADSWDDAQTVYVRAIDDAVLDGNDTQVFAPDLQTVNKIRGPLIIEGAAGAGSLSLPDPLMMPWELNIRQPDGNVVAFEASDTPAGLETMTVEYDDLMAVVNHFKEDDPTFTLAKLVGKTLEMAKGPGTGVVLDPLRPDDKFNRFWLITAVAEVSGEAAGDPQLVTLTLQNPSAVDPTLANVIAPDASSEYAIASLSVNFFADEREQVDYLFMYDSDSVANDKGALTSSDGVVRGFDAATLQMVVETSALQRTATLLDLDDITELEQLTLTVSVGPGAGNVYVIDSVSDEEGDTKILTLTLVAGTYSGSDPTVRSEYRIQGSDRYGRIVGFGMGPNILVNGRPQGGGITYGDIEVVQVELGEGDDEVRVDYATNAEDHSTRRTGDYRTLTILRTGGGDDTVTVTLEDGDGHAAGDGEFAVDLGEGNDWLLGGASTRSLVAFGGAGDDHITTGSADDIVFGDRGRVDYTKKIVVDGQEYDQIITRLGYSVPQNPVNPHVTFATDTTLTDDQIGSTFFPFPTSYDGLLGLSVQLISADGHVQFRTIIGNTADTITVDAPWTEFPVFTGPEDDRHYYRVSSFPDDQTDGLFRDARVIWSVDDDVGGADTVDAGAGDDIVIGGAGDDDLVTGAGVDMAAGDDVRMDFAPLFHDSIENRLVQISDPGSVGDDELWGSDDEDLLIGGLGKDILHGEGADDILIGDTVTITFDELGRMTRIIAGASEGDVDTLFGGGGQDLAIGGAGGDFLWGGADADLLLGDAATIDFDVETGSPVTVDALTEPTNGGADTVRGEAGDDVVVGGAAGDRLDGGADRDLMVGDGVVLQWSDTSHPAVTPRYRTLAGAIYKADGTPDLGANVTPSQLPAWSRWHIELDQALAPSRFGGDYIAGGAGDDTIFGQRGNDIIQGDGSIGTPALPTNVSAARVDGLLVVVGSVEDAQNDGDDYIEGNAGDDVIFGNLGQDDLIGGSSTLFSLGPVGDTAALARRDDGRDFIFGGAGTDLQRNNPGDGFHGVDSDMILGDNGNIYRLLGGSAANGFAYDDLFAKTGERAIVVRAAELLDYTPGNENTGAAVDQGAGDELHGESGDDFVYGMTGNDVMFGEGQDDDLIGGWGHDWISGGTGSDGVLGDDGRIFTSRNGIAEALYGIAATTEAVISTPGSVQTAVINVTGQLKKAVDLQPFGLGLDTLYDPANADDILYGGWGDDFLHGGWGDDAISGAEALDRDGYLLYAKPVNAGNVLGYDTATGEFAKYDEYHPMTRLPGFVLDFDASDGFNGAVSVNDGADKIFGDHGNDWIVGGTGRDDLYGGWGDDLLNADDDLSTASGANTSPDTNASYEDRAYGGAGRDVLIGNTGGDRLIDWVGEFNSYIVPFAPFGNATVSRTLQPQLAEFLYALAKSDGADQTLGNAGDPRSGEPYGELGLVRQQDFAWQSQTGAPADPQAGNVPGGKRDVLRSADFNTGQMQGFAPDSGTWQVSGGALLVTADSAKADAVAVYQVGDALPSYFEISATIKAIKPTGGWNANSYVVFDYQSKTNFKFAGVDVSTNKLVIGQRTAAGWQVMTQGVFTSALKSDTWYNLMVYVNGLTVTLAVDNRSYLSYAFQPTVVDGYKYGLNWGLVGFGSNKARGAIDNIAVQVVPPTATTTYRESFDTGAGSMFDTGWSGTWQATGGRLVGTPAAPSDVAWQLADLSGVTQLQTTSLLDISATLRTAARAGIVFDRYGDTDFKFAAIDVATRQVLIGHRTSAGWFIDAAVSQNTLNATTDYQLGVVVRGSSVSVTLNGQAVTGFVYNAVGVDGRFGLFSRGGAASFDAVTIKTNDPAVPALLEAAQSSPSPAGSSAAPTSQQLAMLAQEAARRWRMVEDTSHTALLDAVQIEVADLPGQQLASYESGRLLIDVDGGGSGWFVDATPMFDEEFRESGFQLSALRGSAADGRIDLLSVLAHEMGHAMGLGHGEGVMSEQLAAGARVMPTLGLLDETARQRAAQQQAALAAGASQGMPWRVDWSSYGDVEGAAGRGNEPGLAVRDVATGGRAGVPAPAGTDWRERFVTQLGRSPDKADPNASLRVLATAGASAQTSARVRVSPL